MKYTVYDIQGNEYDIEANKVQITDRMVEFYKYDTYAGAFRLDLIVGFCVGDDD